MNNMRQFKFLLVIVLFCTIAIAVINLFTQLSQSLKEGITAEIVGGGILGGIVAAVFFYLQESDEYQTSKTRARSFYEQKLLLDIQENIDKGSSLWNLSRGKEFYFDDSLINSLYNIYHSSFDQINNYHSYFPENKLIKKYDEFYRTIRSGYVIAEKMENIIYQNVRRHHYNRGIISANDPDTKNYIRGKLFANMLDSELCKYLEWQTIPERVTELYTAFEVDTDVIKIISELKSARKVLLIQVEEIKELYKIGSEI